MMWLKRDFCSDCRRYAQLRYTGHDKYSVYAVCIDCGVRFDLINDEDGDTLRQFHFTYSA